MAILFQNHDYGGGGSSATVVTASTFTKGTNIASANDITLPGDGFAYDVTGTVQVNRAKPDAAMLANGFGIVALRFTGACPVHHNQTSGSGFLPIQLRNGWGPFTMSAGKWHLFMYDGSAFVHADATLLANSGLYYGQNSSSYVRSESGIFLVGDGNAYTSRFQAGKTLNNGGWQHCPLIVGGAGATNLTAIQRGVEYGSALDADYDVRLPPLSTVVADQEFECDVGPNGGTWTITVKANAADTGANIDGTTGGTGIPLGIGGGGGAYHRMAFRANAALTHWKKYVV